MHLRTFVATATFAAAIALPSAALAQSTDDPYTRRPPGEVLGENLQRPVEVLPAQITRNDPAPTSTLPVTGTDAVGLTVIGLAAIAGGTVLVRRSRVRPAEATA